MSYFDIGQDVKSHYREKLKVFHQPEPLVSIVIPAWNEEDNLHKTIFSLANNKFTFPCELLIVNNNSTDRTQLILDDLGVRSETEPRQGIGFARQHGLLAARGKYLLNCDSDTLYPPGWIQTMTNAMVNNERKGVVLVKGTYSFIPSDGNNRFVMFFHELLGDVARSFRYRNSRYLTVLGFNFGFIREKGIEAAGFTAVKPRVGLNLRGTPDYVAFSEDGAMARRLLSSGGKMIEIKSKNGCVWTSDRRLMYSGNIFSAFA